MVPNDKIIRLSSAVTDEELSEAFELYEVSGSMRAVADATGIDYPALRAAMNRDPIRLAHVRATRAERIAKRWEDVEQVSSSATGKLIEAYNELIVHVLSSIQAGVEETDLVDPYAKKKGTKLSPMQALQYLIDKRILEQVSKAGMNAAKISEGMRQIAQTEVRMVKTTSSNDMDDATLERHYEELLAAGLPIPPGLAHWWALRQKPSAG